VGAAHETVTDESNVELLHNCWRCG
jgi:hypothetical protein